MHRMSLSMLTPVNNKAYSYITLYSRWNMYLKQRNVSHTLYLSGAWTQFTRIWFLCRFVRRVQRESEVAYYLRRWESVVTLTWGFPWSFLYASLRGRARSLQLTLWTAGRWLLTVRPPCVGSPTVTYIRESPHWTLALMFHPYFTTDIVLKEFKLLY